MKVKVLKQVDTGEGIEVTCELTPEQAKAVHEGTVGGFSIREVSEALQTELWSEQKRIAAKLLKQKP